MPFGEGLLPASVSEAAAQAISAFGKILEQLGNTGMVHRAAFAIRHQILLADIGDVGRILVFREQVIEGLIPQGADILGNRFVPFLAIGEDRVDIENHAAKIELLVFHHIADREAGFGVKGGVDSATGLRRIELGSIHKREYSPPPARNKLPRKHLPLI